MKLPMNAITENLNGAMRTKNPIPQFEFSWTSDTFNLIRDDTLDGERIVKEKEQQEQDQKEQQKKQKELISF